MKCLINDLRMYLIRSRSNTYKGNNYNPGLADSKFEKSKIIGERVRELYEALKFT
jgi:hypothetical protein